MNRGASTYRRSDTKEKSVQRAVRCLLTKANGKDTTVGAVAQRTKLSCDEVIAVIDGFYWIHVIPTHTDHPKESWAVFEDGE